MNSLKQIFKLAKKNNATRGMTWKEYLQYAADRGITDAQLRSGNLDTRRLANLFFYGTLPVISKILGAPVLLEAPDIIGPEVPVQLIQQPITKTIKTTTKKSPKRTTTTTVTEEVSDKNAESTEENSKLEDNGFNIPNAVISSENSNYDWVNRLPTGGTAQSDTYEANVLNKNTTLGKWIKNLVNNAYIPKFLTAPLYGYKPEYGENIVKVLNTIGNVRDLLTYKDNTKYYQQGGRVQQSSELDAVMQFVQALAQTLQADPNQVILAAQLNPDALKSAVQVYQQTLDIQQAAQAFSQALQSQAQAAKHGAKLNYLKTLKNQCAEDKELVYFKKGGKVDCGCRKKDGGEIKEEKKESAVDKFKKMAKGDKVPLKKLDQAAKDSIEINKYNDLELQITRPGKIKKVINGKDTTTVWTPDRTKAPYKKTEKKEKGGEVKKDCGGSKMKLKKGDKVCPKCGKVHAAGMGCAVAKFKLRGGQL